MASLLIQRLEQCQELLKPSDIIKLTKWGKTKVYEMLDAGDIPTVDFSNHTRRTRSRKPQREDGRSKNAYRVDPLAWAFVLRHANPILNEATRRRAA